MVGMMLDYNALFVVLQIYDKKTVTGRSNRKIVVVLMVCKIHFPRIRRNGVMFLRRVIPSNSRSNPAVSFEVVWFSDWGPRSRRRKSKKIQIHSRTEPDTT